MDHNTRGRDSKRNQEIEEDFGSQAERKRLSEQDVQLIRNGQQTANDRSKQAISPENNGAEHIADGARRCFSVLVRRIHFFQALAEHVFCAMVRR